MQQVFVQRVFGKSCPVCCWDLTTTGEPSAGIAARRVPADGIRRYRLGEQPFSAWVFRIARNRLIDLQRRRTRCRQVPWDENIPATNGHGQGPMKQVLVIDEIRLGLADLTEAQGPGHSP